MERKLSAKERIDLCFLELLQEKSIARISVTEICSAVGINRATFYKHYLDVYDLLESIENRVLEQLQVHLAEGNPADDNRYEDLTLRMVTYLGDMDGRYWVLFAPERGGSLASKAFDILRHFTFPVLREALPQLKPEKVEMLYHYISRGFSGIISHWFVCGKQFSPQEVADTILEFSTATIRGIS